MNLSRRRARRPDDWPSSHVRARAALSERLDGSLEPPESTWLEGHLAACADCQAIADAYASQQLELRALRDQMPTPPRDLWARTGAAIEADSRFRDGRARDGAAATGGRRSARTTLAPSALLAAALVVVVAVGLLTSSRQLPGNDATGPSGGIARGTPGPVLTAAGPTPIAVAQRIEFLTRDAAGEYSLNVRKVDQVCPASTPQPCNTSSSVSEHPVDLNQTAATVFGSAHSERLIVISDPSGSTGGTVSVVSLASPAVDATASPPVTSSPPATTTPPPTPTTAPTSPPPTATSSVRPTTRPPTPPPGSGSPTPTPTPPATPDLSSLPPSPSVVVSAPPDGGPIEIARDVILVGQSAAYSPSGRWFAFTARPANGSVGPDIYAWKVGDALARRLTDDHRSEFGSWAADTIVGSTVVAVARGNGSSAKTDLQPLAFLLDPATAAITTLPQTGRVWRPAIDPSGRRAVYWSGSLRAVDLPGFVPDNGRLVLGDWAVGGTAPGDGASPSSAATALNGDQGAARHETTIQAGRVADFDARWDRAGTHLAVWIADPATPTIGTLSLYAVDSFDGKIDLKTPLLDHVAAAAGYSIADGQLVWAEPSGDGSVANGTLQLLAWTDEGVGTVQTVTGPVIVVR